MIRRLLPAAEMVLVLFAVASPASVDGGQSLVQPVLAAADPCSGWLAYFVVVVAGLCVLVGVVGKLIGNLAEVRRTKLRELAIREDALEKGRNLLAHKQRLIEQDEQAVLALAGQKSEGFPWLADAYAEYFLLKQLKEAEELESKKHPAVKSAERLREIARDRRVIEKKFRELQWIVAYWLDLFPFLEDCDDVDEELLRRLLSKTIEVPFEDAPDIDVDPVRFVLNKLPEDEYRKLSTAERNQRALDIWCARNKSRWQIGREYERFIGYLHEQQGFHVYYQGILEGYEDLGRDLIARKGLKTLVVQCKCWSAHKVIHEKHVNQLFGTKTKYTIEKPEEKVSAVLFTSTVLSDKAKEFARHLKVQFHENCLLQDYPRIKCNVSWSTGEKIYHLPFDQMYDRTSVDSARGETYVSTVAEAERLGFRRAWKWHGGGEGNSESGNPSGQGSLF